MLTRHVEKDAAWLVMRWLVTLAREGQTRLGLSVGGGMSRNWGKVVVQARVVMVSGSEGGESSRRGLAYLGLSTWPVLSRQG